MFLSVVDVAEYCLVLRSGVEYSERCRVFISVGYGFLELRNVAKYFFMFLSVS